jgi:hypothetical protein
LVVGRRQIWCIRPLLAALSPQQEGFVHLLRRRQPVRRRIVVVVKGYRYRHSSRRRRRPAASQQLAAVQPRRAVVDPARATGSRPVPHRRYVFALGIYITALDLDDYIRWYLSDPKIRLHITRIGFSTFVA